MISSSGLPQGQERSEKNGGFWKKSEEKTGNLTQYEKSQILLGQIYKIPNFLMPSNGKILIKNPIKSD